MLHYQISELNDKMGLADIRQRPILNREMEWDRTPKDTVMQNFYWF